MSTRRRLAAAQQQPRASKSTSKAQTPADLPRQESSKLMSGIAALEECAGAICLVEVTMHSLESQEIAFPEREVLKRALKTIWSVHDWIDELRPGDTDHKRPNREVKS